MTLTGFHSLVTGAASGIGRAVAIGMAKAGARLALLDIDAEGAERTATAIQSAGGDSVILAADVTDRAAVDIAVAQIARQFGRLDALVNNAGVSKSALFERQRQEDWQLVWKTNLEGTLHCTQASLPLLKAAGTASVVNISSILARNSFRKLSAYAASKGAIASLSQSLALELGPFGIRVNCIQPGLIRTDMTRNLHGRWLYRKVIERRTPLRRLGEPEDVADLAVFLASPAARFITGQSIIIDGGLTLHAV